MKYFLYVFWMHEWAARVNNQGCGSVVMINLMKICAGSIIQRGIATFSWLCSFDMVFNIITKAVKHECFLQSKYPHALKKAGSNPSDYGFFSLI